MPIIRKTTTRHGFRRFVVEEVDFDRVDSTREEVRLSKNNLLKCVGDCLKMEHLCVLLYIFDS